MSLYPSCSTIAQHLRRQQILRLPPSVDYKVISKTLRWSVTTNCCICTDCFFVVPSGTDLSDLPRLEFTRGSLAVWKGPLHNACLKNPSVKLRVLSALIMAIHGRGCKNWNSSVTSHYTSQSRSQVRRKRETIWLLVWDSFCRNTRNWRL